MFPHLLPQLNPLYRRPGRNPCQYFVVITCKMSELALFWHVYHYYIISFTLKSYNAFIKYWHCLRVHMHSHGEHAVNEEQFYPSLRVMSESVSYCVCNTCDILVRYWTAETDWSLLTSGCGCIGSYTFTVCSLMCSNMLGVSSLAQHPLLVGTVQTSICKDPHISVCYNQCGLVLLNVPIMCINEHFAPTQTTALSVQ